jgi:hypothetical protein
MESQLLAYFNGECPNSKKEEDKLLDEAIKWFKTIKITVRSPASISEQLVFLQIQQKESECSLKKRFKTPSWLPDRKYIETDLIFGKNIGEIKSLKYFNGFGKRGQQGTAMEKFDHVFAKYIGFKHLGYKVYIILCSDMCNVQPCRMYLDAWKGKDVPNECVKNNYNLYKDFLTVSSLTDFLSQLK